MVGFLLSVFGIILFIVLWIVFGQSGMEAFPRLVLSLCLPPAAIALVMGIYILVVRPKA
ncbi:MAG: hypothetical protein U0694_10215 [Anaerolineae bacterium]